MTKIIFFKFKSQSGQILFTITIDYTKGDIYN